MTTINAELLNVQTQRGALATGFYPDIVAMPQNPLDDIEPCENSTLSSTTVRLCDDPRNDRRSKGHEPPYTPAVDGQKLSPVSAQRGA
jgi:hypothetical protein